MIKAISSVMNLGVTERFIPQTSDRLFSDFTTDERRAMYDYVVANTVAPDIGEDIADINKPSDTSEDKQSKTMLELLAQERNLKRRRAKYKGVHTNKKSHTEILREIIEQQLEMFKEHLAEKFGTSFPNDDGEAENKSTASSEKRLFKDRESLRNNPTHGRFYDENPSPCLSQLDRKDSHSNSHKDRYSRSADDHRSRDRDRHCHRSDEDYNNFHGKKHSSRADENRSKDRHRSSDSKNDSRERHRDEKYIKEHKSHKHEDKYDKEQRAKHKRRSRSKERRKYKKREKSRSRSRSRKCRNRSRSRNRRSRSKSN